MREKFSTACIIFWMKKTGKNILTEIQVCFKSALSIDLPKCRRLQKMLQHYSADCLPMQPEHYLNARSGQQMTTVMIVDNEPSIVELLDFTLKGAGWDTTIARNAADAWELLRAGPLPHLMLLDWMLPNENGLMLLSRIRSDRQYQYLPVIMVTAKGMEENKVAGLDHGADDYITKPFSPRELIARINAHLRRKSPEEAYAAVTALSFGPIVIDTLNCAVSVDGQRIDLAHAEYKLLRYLMSHPERLFTREQLVENVWGGNIVITRRTVDVHMVRIRKAIGTASRLIKTIRGMGYILTEK
jgi:two-component system phosphate regulon response regulator PhoB